MARYIVISYDADEQQSFVDLIEAKTDRDAKEIVAKARPYAVPIDAATEESWMVFLVGLADRNAHTSAKELAEASGEELEKEEVNAEG